jgi:flavorubredoxin
MCSGFDSAQGVLMETTVHEIAQDVYRLSTCVPDAVPGGFTFTHYLIDADEPLLFHCGPRGMFDLVAPAAARVVPLDRLRWVSFGHYESDECGSMNQWLAAAPHAEIAFNGLGCMVSVGDMADRPPRALADGEVLDLGGHRVRVITTPHVPHAWEAQVMFDETTSTLLCGDLFTQTGEPPALVHDVDLVSPAMEAEALFNGSCLTASTAPTIRSLADLAPRTLALMHGPAFAGDCEGALHALADSYADLFTTSTDAVVVR